jgi:hypothetical protein
MAATGSDGEVVDPPAPTGGRRVLVWAIRIALLIAVIVVVRFIVERDDGTGARALRVGMCLTEVPSGSFRTIKDVDCDRPHVAEVYTVGIYAPFSDTVDDAVQKICFDQLSTAVRQQLIDVDAEVSYVLPRSQRDSNRLFCIATFEQQSGPLEATEVSS